MTDSAKNGGKTDADHHAERDAVQTADQDPRRRKANRMTVFLSVVTLTVFGLLASIAVANWQKGGLGNYWHAFGWGVAAYVMLGLGTAFTYYYAIIKPAKADQRAREQRKQEEPRQEPPPKERPELFVEQVIIEPFQAGKPEMVSLIFRNRGKVVAENVSIETTHAHHPKSFDGPLVYETKPPDTILTIGPDSVFTMVSRSPWVTNANWIKEIVNGDRLLFVYGKGHYEDRKREKYPLSFCYMYEPSLPRNMVICPTRFLPSDKPKPEKKEPIPKGVGRASSIDAGAGARQISPAPLQWTDYEEDYFHGAVWRWKYRPEMGDKEPRNIFGYCPECDRLLKSETTSPNRKPDGLFVFAFRCGKHISKVYWLRSPTRDPIDAIRVQIREKLQSEAWREVVKKQVEARDGRV